MVFVCSRHGNRVAVLAAALACGSLDAQTGYSSGFEALTASAGGTQLWNPLLSAGTLGQDNYYWPTGTTSSPFLAYTYAGNALGVPSNPRGGGVFIAGNGPGGATFARAQRDLSYGLNTGYWTFATDVLVQFNGTLPSAQNIGSLSAQPNPLGQGFIMLARWTDPNTAANWSADYVWCDGAGVQVTVVVGDPGFQNLVVNRWYRWETIVNLASNTIVEVRITDLVLGTTAINNPVAAYLGGGLVSSGPLTSVRFFGGTTVAGNTTVWDNIDVMPGWVSFLPPGPQPCVLGPCCYPAGTLRVSGFPRVGSIIQHLADLPAGGASVFSFVALAHSFALGPGCGVPLPGITNRNVLIGLPAAAILISGPWIGPGNPVAFPLSIPANATFIGVTLYSQAAFMDPVPPLIMTQGTAVVVGG